MPMTVLTVSNAEKLPNRDFSCPLMVSKAPIFSSQSKHKVVPSESQQTLLNLLEKRRERYRRLIPRVNKRKLNGRALSIRALSNESQQEQLTIGVHNLLARRQCTVRDQRMVQLHTDDCKRNSGTSPAAAAKCQVPSIATFYPTYCDNKQAAFLVRDQDTESQRSAQNLLDNLECRDLAEHLVSRAKVRLRKRRKRKLQSLQMHHEQSPLYNNAGSRFSIQSLTTRTNISRKSSPQQKDTAISHILSRATQSQLQCPHHSPDSPLTVSQNKEGQLEQAGLSMSGVPILSQNGTLCVSQEPVEVQPLKIVYWSEKHSITPRSTGIPNVPPVTPSTSYSASFKYILSMADIKSQRQLKSRLNEISERQQTSQTNKITATKEDEERKKKKEEIVKLKEQQRAEIYALNKVMAALEAQKFQDFISGKV